MVKQYDEIVEVKNRIFDSTLLIGSILGLLTFIMSLRNFYASEIRFNYILNFMIIALFLIIYLFRKRLSPKIKSLFVLTGLYVLSFIDIYKLGTYSTAKILLVLIPFFSFIAFNNKNIFLFSLGAVLIYFFFIWQFTTGAITLTIDLKDRNLQISSWLVNLFLIVIVAWAVLTIVNQFNKTFYQLIHRLEEQNKELILHREHLELLVAERSRELEEANEELNNMNEELYQNKNIIETQNLELTSTLENLKKTQSQLIQSEKMASLGVLSAGVAHEINNPLNFIMGGYTGLEEYFRKSGKQDEKNIPVFLESIRSGVERATGIVQALNQFSRSNDTDCEKCDIHSVIDNSLIILSNLYKDRISIHKKYSEVPIITQANVSKLIQVFVNIITNSIHAMEARGEITILTQIKEGIIEIEISDTGCGISSENLTKISDPFFTTKEPGKGTGLGLSIVYSIIHDYHGEMYFDSEPGKGTKVKIFLPADS